MLTYKTLFRRFTTAHTLQIKALFSFFFDQHFHQLWNFFSKHVIRLK